MTTVCLGKVFPKLKRRSSFTKSPGKERCASESGSLGGSRESDLDTICTTDSENAPLPPSNTSDSQDYVFRIVPAMQNKTNTGLLFNHACLYT